MYRLAIHNRNDLKRIDIAITTNNNNVDHQHDSSSISFDLIKEFFLENLLDKWKNLARELDVNENEIEMISRENRSLKDKFSLVRIFFFYHHHQYIYSNFSSSSRFWIWWRKHVITIYVKYSLICSKVSNNVDECHIIVIKINLNSSSLHIHLILDELRQIITPFYPDLQ